MFISVLSLIKGYADDAPISLFPMRKMRAANCAAWLTASKPPRSVAAARSRRDRRLEYGGVARMDKLSVRFAAEPDTKRGRAAAAARN